MKSIFQLGATFAILAAAIALCAPGPGASSARLVIANTYTSSVNFGSIFKLAGTAEDPSLRRVAMLSTDVMADGLQPTPNVQVMRVGADTCLFLADSQYDGNTITSFKYPGLVQVGDYTDPNVLDSSLGISIVAHGHFLIASYTGLVSQQYASRLDTWNINPGCALSLAATYVPDSPASSLAITPDGKTLVLAYLDSRSGPVASFSIAANGSLSELSTAFTGADFVNSSDITRDGQYAVFGINGPNQYEYTELAAFPIQPNGQLGELQIFGGDGSLGSGINTGWIWFSPNGKFLFTDALSSEQVTTLNFAENPLDVTYACMTNLKEVQNNSNSTVYPGQLATALPSGAGGLLYVAESMNPSAAIGILSIDESTGCTTEVHGSPSNVQRGSLDSITAWPPRPF
jgi:hypothetical protein